MRLKLPLFVVVVLPAVVLGQSWCAPGAAWTYRYQDWGGNAVDYRMEHLYAADTLYEGLSAKRIQCSSAGYAFGQPVSGNWTVHEAVTDDLVLVWESNGFGEPGWDTLYWFGAEVGDRWWPPGHPASCAPYGMLEVLAVGDTLIQGVTLVTWSLGQVDQDGNAFPEFLLIERIGMTPRVPFIFDCGIIIEYFMPSFVCYSDVDFQVPEGSDCFLTLGAEAVGHAGFALTLVPNPGTTFHLTSLGQRPAHIRLLDMQGRVVLEASAVMEQWTVDASALLAGAYVVEVTTDVGREVLRWVKE